jgi:rRNA processing protein Krr1/Pno1
VVAPPPSPPAAAARAPSRDEGGWEVAKPAKKKKNKPAAAAAAAAAPKPMVSEASSVKTKVEIESKKLGILIGPGGVTLHTLQDATNTRINTPNKGDDTGRTSIVTVEGPADGVATCARAIKDLCSKGYSNVTHPQFSEGSVQMWPLYYPILIGKEGSGVRALQDAFGVKVVMPEKRLQVDNKPQYVKLIGSKAGIDQAKVEIKAMMKCYYFPTVSPGLTHIELDLPDSKLRDLIGHRGSTIKSIQGDTRCKIHTPQPNAVVQKVVVVGTPADVARAKVQIDRALVRASENREARNNERFDDYAEDYEDEDDANY